MMITWNTDCNAPGCPGEIVAEDGRAILVQTDWDYPGTASTFGWSKKDVQQKCEDDGAQACEHDGTDGTIPCKGCGLTQSDFITAAYDWLCNNDGATVDDPGYFLEE